MMYLMRKPSDKVATQETLERIRESENKGRKPGRNVRGGKAAWTVMQQFSKTEASL